MTVGAERKELTIAEIYAVLSSKVGPTKVGLFCCIELYFVGLSINWAVKIMLKIEIHVDSVFHFLTMIQ